MHKNTNTDYTMKKTKTSNENVEFNIKLRVINMGRCMGMSVVNQGIGEA